MKLYDAIAQGYQQVAGWYRGDYFGIDDNDNITACAMGCAYIGVNGLTASEISKYSHALGGVYDWEPFDPMDADKELVTEQVANFNDDVAESIEDVILYVKENFPDLEVR